MNPNASFSQISTEYPFHSGVRVLTEYPVEDEAKYRVFKCLWHKGLFITNGDSFGGDFLTYPSDPNLFHASQIIHIVDRDQMFDHHYLSSCSRLSVTVKKKCVFAYLDENESVVFQTLSWINPKLRELYAKIAATNDQSKVGKEEGESASSSNK
jgi:tRNA splicing endonuclease